MSSLWLDDRIKVGGRKLSVPLIRINFFYSQATHQVSFLSYFHSNDVKSIHYKNLKLLANNTHVLTLTALHQYYVGLWRLLIDSVDNFYSTLDGGDDLSLTVAWQLLVGIKGGISLTTPSPLTCSLPSFQTNFLISATATAQRPSTPPPCFLFCTPPHFARTSKYVFRF